MDGMNGMNNQSVDLSKQPNNQEQPQNNNGYNQTQGGYNYGQAQNNYNYGQTQDNSQQNYNTQYGQNGQGFNSASNQPNGFDAAGIMGAGLIGVNAPDYILWLVLGIVQICTICCCNCTAPITGVITLIMVIMANNSYKQGNMMDYQSKMKVGKIICLIGFGLMIVGFIISLIFNFFDIVLSMFS